MYMHAKSQRSLGACLLIVLFCSPLFVVQKAGRSSLVVAVDMRRADLAAVLIGAKVDLEAKTQGHRTALHIAAETDARCTQLLLDAKSNVHAADKV